MPLNRNDCHCREADDDADDLYAHDFLSEQAQAKKGDPKRIGLPDDHKEGDGGEGRS